MKKARDPWPFFVSELQDSEFPDPNIPVANRITVILKQNRCFAVYFVQWEALICCRSLKCNVVMNQNTVLEDCYERRNDQGSLIAESWSREHNVIALPLAGLSAGIHHGNLLFVERTGLAVGICLILITV